MEDPYGATVEGLAMRIILTESGGFVGVPVRYEVDASKLDDGTLAQLLRAVEPPARDTPARATSAGGTTVRLEHDDGTTGELTLSHAAPPPPSLAALVGRLRAAATLIRKA
jgi:hypothetical protein